uniref:Kinase n=1 Tax=Phallusia mammillata TaxID=59560 RepID=A0A6F9DEK2_9ASCI|nr:inositol polyphosphate multikinase [Phallusia mammillata]
MSKSLLPSRPDEKPTRKQVGSDSVKSEAGDSSTQTCGMNPPLPRGCRPLSHQVAGHRFGQGRLGIGMLQHMDGSILKPVQPPPRGGREVSFYQKTFDSKCEDPVLLTLRPFLPKFLGMWNTSSPYTDSYLKLEDACRRFRNPSILDIKIGRVSYDPDANMEKQAIETAKYPPLQELGFQLLGMRISGPSPNEAVFYDKKYGRSLTKGKIFEGLNLFFSGNEAWKKYIVKAFVQRLELILGWFESQERYQFYSSSLLLIYEGEFVDGSSDSDEEFIHKYRQLQFPTMHTDSYLATVRRFLNKNVDEENKTKGPNESEDGGNHGDGPRTQGSGDNNDTTGKDSSGKPDHVTPPQTDHVTPSSDHVTPPQADPVDVSSNAPTQTTTGHESGYSSEAESKLSSRRASERLQRDFVTSLNRRIQESARDYVKYRFPPEIVDVKMIDFAHVFEDNHTDDNYIFGLRNLIHYLRQVMKSC